MTENGPNAQTVPEHAANAGDPDPFGHWPEPDPAWLKAAEEQAAAKRARVEAAAARKARGIARRAPLAEASWRVVLGNATEDDIRRVKRAASARKSYYKRKAARRLAAEAEQVRNVLEAHSELVRIVGLGEVERS